MQAETSGPVAAVERHTILDALRGWALLGILLANQMTFGGFVLVTDTGRERMLLSEANDLTELLLEWLVVGKFYAIFSLLFGIGFAIQLARLEQRGEGARRYLRRLAVLFLIGLAHLLLIWLGDILALYAIMGAVLLLFRRATDRTLLVTAGLLWLAAILWSAAIHFGGLDLHGPLFARSFIMLERLGVALDAPIALYASSDILLHLRAHPAEALFRYADLLYQMRFLKVLSMFLIGLWIGRRLVAESGTAGLPLAMVARWGIGLGLPLSLLKALTGMLGGEGAGWALAEEVFYCLGTPLLALGYAAAFALLWQAGRRSWLAWAAPAGRMALTNYVGQSLLQSLIFYGWGLGLVGRFGLAFVLPFGLALFSAQVAFSAWWLSRYRFGPLEWLWRSATYGRAQPMRLARPGMVPA